MHNYRSQPRIIVDGLGADEPSQESVTSAAAATISAARSDTGALTEAGTQYLPKAPGTPEPWTSYQKTWAVLGAISMGVSAYHGYKRNKSVGWALVWGLMGGVLPVITPAVAIAQGYGKRSRG